LGGHAHLGLGLEHKHLKPAAAVIIIMACFLLLLQRRGEDCFRKQERLHHHHGQLFDDGERGKLLMVGRGDDSAELSFYESIIMIILEEE